MARIVKHEATDPFKIEPANFPRDPQGNLKPIFICMCGLSSKMPICDGTHKGCRDEEPGKTYVYEQGQRREAAGPQ